MASTTAAQPELPLDLPRGGAPDLREAYEKSNLAYHGVSFERAMKEAQFFIPLKHVAETLAVIRIEGSVQ